MNCVIYQVFNMEEAQYQEQIAKEQFEQEQALAWNEQEEAEKEHYRQEIASLTTQLKQMSIDNPRYAATWDRRVDMKHRLSELETK